MNSSDKARLNQVGVPDRGAAGKLGDSSRGVGDIVEDAISAAGNAETPSSGTKTITGDLTVTGAITVPTAKVTTALQFTDSNVAISETGTNDMLLNAAGSDFKFSSDGGSTATATMAISGSGVVTFNKQISSTFYVTSPAFADYASASVTATPVAATGWTLDVPTAKDHIFKVNAVEVARIDETSMAGKAGLAAGGTTAVKVAAYVATAADSLVLCNPAGAAGSFAVTLPAANAIPGQILTVKVTQIDAVKVITVIRAGADTIEGVDAGQTTLTFTTTAKLASATLQSDGTSKWYVLSTNGTVA